MLVMLEEGMQQVARPGWVGRVRAEQGVVVLHWGNVHDDSARDQGLPGL